MAFVTALLPPDTIPPALAKMADTERVCESRATESRRARFVHRVFRRRGCQLRSGSRAGSRATLEACAACRRARGEAAGNRASATSPPAATSDTGWPVERVANRQGRVSSTIFPCGRSRPTASIASFSIPALINRRKRHSRTASRVTGGEQLQGHRRSGCEASLLAADKAFSAAIAMNPHRRICNDARFRTAAPTGYSVDDVERRGGEVAQGARDDHDTQGR